MLISVAYKALGQQSASNQKEMPNTGRPSKDCHTCRSRRVKCTLERPECQRCLRIGKRCPGYRDEQSLIFRNEDVSSLGGSSGARDRRKSRPVPSLEQEDSGGSTSSLNTSSDITIPSDWSFQGIRLRDLDQMIFNKHYSASSSPIHLGQWSRYAVPLVLALLSHEVGDQRVFGRFQVLASLLLRGPDNSPLTMCCEALGIAYLANKFNPVGADTVRDQAHGRALAATNNLVGDSTLCQQDETTLCVWLLSLYEVVLGPHALPDGSSTRTWSIHAQGQIEILRLRGPRQLETWTGRNLFWLVTLSAQVNTFATTEDYPYFTQDWLTASQDNMEGSSLAFFYLSTFAYNLSLLGKRIREAMTTDDTQFLPWTITDLWNRLQGFQIALDQAVHDHSSDQPTSPDSIYITNLYRSYYSRSLHHMLDLLSSPQVTENDHIQSEEVHSITWSIRQILQSLAAATLATATLIMTCSNTYQEHSPLPSSMPLTLSRPLCWADILKLAWPLRVLGVRKYLLESSQAALVDTLLQTISQDFCIRQALVVAPPSSPYPNDRTSTGK